jgi:hypothetical protein
VKTDTTKVMQEALQAAVTRMNHGATTEPAAMPTDPIGALMSILPKLLNNNNETGEELLEKLDSLQKGDITALREQVLILRKQCYRMIKSQEQILAELGEMQKQQTAVGNAVLDLAEQMTRLQVVEQDEPEPENADPPAAAPPRPSQASGAPSEQRRTARPKQTKNGTRVRP